MTVIAPDASTTKVLTSGGSSADPSWVAVPAGGNVSSANASAQRIEWYILTNGGSCAITHTSDTGASTSHTATGDCQTTFGTAFANFAVCIPTVGPSSNVHGARVTAQSKTAVTTETYLESSRSATDDDFMMICSGDK